MLSRASALVFGRSLRSLQLVPAVTMATSSTTKGGLSKSGQHHEKEGKVLHKDLMNAGMLRAQYAVRGELYRRATELADEGKDIIYTNSASEASVTRSRPAGDSRASPDVAHGPPAAATAAFHASGGVSGLSDTLTPEVGAERERESKGARGGGHETQSPPGGDGGGGEGGGGDSPKTARSARVATNTAGPRRVIGRPGRGA